MKISIRSLLLLLPILFVSGGLPPLVSAQVANAKMRALLGQLNKTTEFLELDLRMQNFWNSQKKFRVRQDELTAGLRRNQMLTKNASWRRRTKAALTAMRHDAHELTTVKKPSPRAATLLRDLRLVQLQTNIFTGNYLKFMASSKSSDAGVTVQNYNKLIEYINAAIRERQRLSR